MYKFAFIAALVGTASAANTTTSLWLVGFDEQTVLGSIIASDATATTYSLACGDPDNCGIPSPFTFTQGPSTVAYSYVEAMATGITETVELACVVTSSASGVCTANIDAVSITSQATTTSFTDASELGLMAVTITAGAAASNTAASTTGSSKSAATTGSSSRSSSGSATGSAASNSKNAGMPMVTGAPWVMGVMAAGMAFAAA